MAVAITRSKPSGRSDGFVWVEGILFTGAGAINDGEWFDARGMSTMSVHVFGGGVGTVQVRGSNATAPPLNTVHGVPIGADISATAVEAIAFISTPMNWMKVRISAWTSGVISAAFSGQLT